ncbi:MAG TPA: hypothetical protein VHE30_17475 [Polyangiaceae bacterium]|nr:hypothetical protein [Polyangiaceae bacterium]
MKASHNIKFHRLGIAALLLSSLRVISCGGSASETPPPLEPDPSVLHVRQNVAPEKKKAPEADYRGMDDLDEGARPSAPATWGAPSRAHRAPPPPPTARYVSDAGT